MYWNFNYPKKTKDGECYLRFDDTNPKTEKEEFVDQILIDLKWLGYIPDKITYTSDYFETIYDLTIKLISNGDALE